jgi:aspartyl-tRNA(Asn)/glutamyl-tRNA(Gln) amidotransferase subunit C
VIIDDNILRKLEKLSYLTISENKRDDILNQLSDILEYVESLKELDTDSIDSYFSTLEGGTVMRDDIPIIDRDIPKIILSNAPETEDDFFIVPAIID